MVDTDRDGDLNCGDAECIGDAVCPALTESEPNDTFGTADAYAAGFIGAIGLPMDSDWVSITVAAGSTLTAEVTDLTGPAGATTGGCARRALDSVVRVFDTNGTSMLRENDDIDVSTNWCSRTMATAPLTGGTYFVQVVSQPMFAPMDTFVYGLTLTVTP
jgi:hypothetical protein